MANTLPTISASGTGMQRYMDEIRKFPMLEPQEEYMLWKKSLQLLASARKRFAL